MFIALVQLVGLLADVSTLRTLRALLEYWSYAPLLVAVLQ